MSDPACLCTALRQAALSGTAHYDRRLAPAGLKVTMFRLLRRVEERPGATISDLARATGLDRSTLGRNLRVLERDGLVALSTARDERARAVTLTDAGAAALQRALPYWRQAQDEMARVLGPDLAELSAALRRVSALSGDGGEASDAR